MNPRTNGDSHVKIFSAEMNKKEPSWLFSRSLWALRLWVVGGWTTLSTVFTIQSYYYRINTREADSWWHLWTINEVYFLLWAAMTPLIVVICKRFRFERGKIASRICIHFIAGVIIAALQRFISDVIILSLPVNVPSALNIPTLIRSLLASIDYGIFIYVIIVFVYHAMDYNRRYREEQLHASQLRADLAAAQLQTLRMQLHPHFLFNTLNAISVLIDEDPKQANIMLGQLSDLLRMALDHVDTQEVPLRKEMEFLDLFLLIHQTRFGDRLTVHKKIDPLALDALVPYLILQPVVENALRHGIGKQPGPGSIEISATRNNGMLRMQVLDTGPGFSHVTHGTSLPGVGLSNTQARLQNLYAGKSVLEMKNLPEGGARVTIEIPYHQGASDDER